MEPGPQLELDGLRREEKKERASLAHKRGCNLTFFLLKTPLQVSFAQNVAPYLRAAISERRPLPPGPQELDATNSYPKTGAPSSRPSLEVADCQLERAALIEGRRRGGRGAHGQRASGCVMPTAWLGSRQTNPIWGSSSWLFLTLDCNCNYSCNFNRLQLRLI